MDFPRVLLFLNLSTGEILVVVLLILLLFGAHRIPDLARALGRAQREFQRARDEVTREADATALTDEEKVRRAAADLGIPTEGRSVDELKQAIAAKLQSGGAAGSS